MDGKQKIASINPTNYELLGEVEPSSEKEINQIVEKAHTAKNNGKS